MKVDLSGKEALKIANNIKREVNQQKIMKKQKSNVPSFWQMLPAYGIIAIVLWTIFVLIVQIISGG